MEKCFKIRWLSGARKGITETIITNESIRIGSVRIGAWNAKYKVIGKG